jgi:hypothetical protein
MSSSGRLRQHDIRAVYSLMGEVTELGRDPHLWRSHVLNRLCRLTGARVGLTMELHNLLPNRNPIPIEPIDIGFAGPIERMSYVQYLTSDLRAVDPSNVALCTFRPHRRFLTVRRREMIEDGAWYQSPVTSEARRTSNVDDFLCSIYRLNHPGSTMGFILYRNWGERPFDERARKLARLFHTELLKKLVRQPAVAGPANLPPHLTQLLQCFLDGHNTKIAAEKLGLSVHTIKSYCKALYERVGVQSRGELLAYFLNRPGQRPIILPVGLNH